MSRPKPMLAILGSCYRTRAKLAMYWFDQQAAPFLVGRERLLVCSGTGQPDREMRTSVHWQRTMRASLRGVRLGGLHSGAYCGLDGRRHPPEARMSKRGEARICMYVFLRMLCMYGLSCTFVEQEMSPGAPLRGGSNATNAWQTPPACGCRATQFARASQVGSSTYLPSTYRASRSAKERSFEHVVVAG
ncbi:hypothetical protein F5Y15DRAFT_275518 [Xylariaceae sp. FL0016]|nr:hypothetical protein F5Y15DRAFT_275518 [Xylariaceae sp. FL0016]